MRIIPTLDYELFLGDRTGTVRNCLIKPMEQLCHAISPINGHFTIFVDASYLNKLRDYSHTSPSASADFQTITTHLTNLRDLGHDIELHLHPQWLYSTYSNGRWTLDHKFYKLKDLSFNEAQDFFKSSKLLLEEIIERPVRIFRAGGFSAQPTSMLTKLFNQNEIVADMSVCPGVYYSSALQEYNYLHCPENKPVYRFEDDICHDTSDGRFIEIPISMHSVSPLFHWQFAMQKILHLSRHKTFGDGTAVSTSVGSIKERLLHTCSCIVSIDGMKSKNLLHARNAIEKKGIDTMCLIGHPKLATPYSIQKFSNFCAHVQAIGDTFTTASDFLYESTH